MEWYHCIRQNRCAAVCGWSSSLSMPKDDGETSLYLVCGNGHLEVAKLISEKGEQKQISRDIIALIIYKYGRLKGAKLLVNLVGYEATSSDNTPSPKTKCQKKLYIVL